MTNALPAVTDFTLDVLGRYICNGFDEALAAGVNRPFDTIIIGGGAFGAVVAHHLLYSDTAHIHRILVLEAGPFVLTEHVQNLPMIGLDVPSPTTVDTGPRNEVWGLPWRSAVPGGFPGLAYCVGGRSIFWGGWSPQPLHEELASPPWPTTVINDLNATYFSEAARELGVDRSNQFLYGDLQNAMRQQLFAGLGQITDAIPLGQLPNYIGVPHGSIRSDLLDMLGLPSTTLVPPTDQDLLDMLKLEAPLAVQGRAPKAGYFALNKFSGVPLLIEAARTAWAEAGGIDSLRRMMLVPRCHVKKLVTVASGNSWQVIGVETNLGTLPVPANGRVVLALATIENTRLALTSFDGPGIPNYGLIGSNLQAHMRSNLVIRIPRGALTTLPASVQELQAAGLFLKGRHTIAGVERHFHLQITGSGLDAPGADAEAKLFKIVPDLDTLDAFQNITDNHVVIAIRGVAEMEGHNAGSQIVLSTETDEFGIRRAEVTITPATNDYLMWDALDAAADQAAQVFAGGSQLEIIARQRDGMGTTYHEMGTLCMGDDPATSVTNPDARFHAVNNTYVTGPALFPTIGSPNPMMPGVALARRLGSHLV